MKHNQKKHQMNQKRETYEVPSGQIESKFS